MIALVGLLSSPASSLGDAVPTVARWGVFEIALHGPVTDNPTRDVDLQAAFDNGAKRIVVHGFYDGGNSYRIRFSPPDCGDWSYRTSSNTAVLDGEIGSLHCLPPPQDDHGAVRVDGLHFAYTDGKPFTPIGTTCYGWAYQREELSNQTLATLKQSPFNKIRMCILPTRYSEKTPPTTFPFVRTDDRHFDVTRMNTDYFKTLDSRIEHLRDLNIQADVILFHPYDKGQMGFDSMSMADNEAYLRYVVDRYSAYRNVWWSMANEYDLVKSKTESDWDELFKTLVERDPYARLRSIHFSQRMYDNSKPWITHASIQNGLACDDFGRATLLREATNKPIVFDEAMYEGNMDRRWGQLSGQDMTLRFWIGTIGGCYVGHGEALRQPSGGSWVSSGGTLVGQSPSRIAFLTSIVDDAPPLEPIDPFYETHIAGQAGNYYLIYFGRESPKVWSGVLPGKGLADGDRFSADVIDTWNLTIKSADSPLTFKKNDNYTFKADRSVDLPGALYTALRLRRISAASTQAATEPSPD